MSTRSLLLVARPLLRVLAVVFVIAAALTASALAASFVAGAQVLAASPWPHPALDPGVAMLGTRLAMAVILAMLGLGHAVVSRLGAMVDSVHAGDPFVAANAARLRVIAWALLAVQLMHMPFQALLNSLRSGTVDIRFDVPVVGLFVVLLLFVLAGVYEEGARMRRDLEGTI